MDIWIVEDGKYALYRRTGECSQCGLCCCKNAINAQIQLAMIQPEQEQSKEGDSKDEDLSAWEGFAAFRAQALWWWIKCDTLDEPRETACDAFENGKCPVWKDDDFPALCRYWPVHPNDVTKFPECDFSFERVAQ